MTQTDLFTKPKTQQQQVYEFIAQKGRRFTHELNELGINHHINDPQTRARELARKGKIWRVRKELAKLFWPGSKEEAWSILPEDK